MKNKMIKKESKVVVRYSRNIDSIFCTTSALNKKIENSITYLKENRESLIETGYAKTEISRRTKILISSVSNLLPTNILLYKDGNAKQLREDKIFRDNDIDIKTIRIKLFNFKLDCLTNLKSLEKLTAYFTKEELTTLQDLDKFYLDSGFNSILNKETFGIGLFNNYPKEFIHYSDFLGLKKYRQPSLTGGVYPFIWQMQIIKYERELGYMKDFCNVKEINERYFLENMDEINGNLNEELLKLNSTINPEKFVNVSLDVKLKLKNAATHLPVINRWLQDQVNKINDTDKLPKELQKAEITEHNIFKKMGQCYYIRFNGNEITIKPSVGIQHLHKIMSNQQLSCLDLISKADSSPVIKNYENEQLADDAGFSSNYSYDEVYDTTALKQFREERENLEKIISTSSDEKTIAYATEELEKLEQFLKSSLYRGKSRKVYDKSIDNARTSIQKAITKARKEISYYDEELSQYLLSNVATGFSCKFINNDGNSWKFF